MEATLKCVSYDCGRLAASEGEGYSVDDRSVESIGDKLARLNADVYFFQRPGTGLVDRKTIGAMTGLPLFSRLYDDGYAFCLAPGGLWEGNKNSPPNAVVMIRNGSKLVLTHRETNALGNGANVRTSGLWARPFRFFSVWGETIPPKQEEMFDSHKRADLWGGSILVGGTIKNATQRDALLKMGHVAVFPRDGEPSATFVAGDSGCTVTWESTTVDGAVVCNVTLPRDKGAILRSMIALGLISCVVAMGGALAYAAYRYRERIATHVQGMVTFYRCLFTGREWKPGMVD